MYRSPDLQLLKLPINGQPPTLAQLRLVNDEERRLSLKNYAARRSVGLKHGVRVMRPTEIEMLFRYLIGSADLNEMFRRLQDHAFMLSERVGKGLFRYNNISQDVATISLNNPWALSLGSDLNHWVFRSIEPILYFAQWLIGDTITFLRIAVPWSNRCDANRLVLRHTNDIIYAPDRICFYLSKNAISARVIRNASEIDDFFSYLPYYLNLGFFRRPISEVYLQKFILSFIEIHKRAPQLGDLADIFGQSIPTIKRQFLAKNISFNRLVKRALRETACLLLNDHSLSIQQISTRLGYADHNAFRRAFSTWTGTPPSRWRSLKTTSNIEIISTRQAISSAQLKDNQKAPSHGATPPRVLSNWLACRDYRKRVITNYLIRRSAAVTKGYRVMRPYETYILYNYLMGGNSFRDTLRRLRTFFYALRERLPPNSVVIREAAEKHTELLFNYTWLAGPGRLYHDVVVEDLQSIFYFIKWFFGKDFHLDYIILSRDFNYKDVQSALAPISKTIAFNSTTVRCGFSSDLLDMPTLRMDRDIKDFFKKLPLFCTHGFYENVSEKRYFFERIKSYYLTYKKIPKIEDIARTEGVHCNRIRERLSAEQLCYRDLVTQYKYDLSKEMIGEQGLSIKEVSFKLGYKNHNSFRRAFKLWSGYPPRQWIDQQKPASHYP